MGDNGITVLYKGGRLASWHRLSEAAKKAYEQEHVELMLTVAQEHRLQRLEGFRLIAPQGEYERFWAMDFPTLEGGGSVDTGGDGTAVRCLRIL